MSIELDGKERVARKQHYCSYCNGIIEKGESYEWAKLIYEGQLYEWKNHKKCGFIAHELWDYIEPDEGMTEEDFNEGCAEFCSTFICPGCEAATHDCYYCLDKIYDFLQTHDFRRVKSENGWTNAWKCYPKEEAVD